MVVPERETKVSPTSAYASGHYTNAPPPSQQQHMPARPSSSPIGLSASGHYTNTPPPPQQGLHLPPRSDDLTPNPLMHQQQHMPWSSHQQQSNPFMAHYVLAPEPTSRGSAPEPPSSTPSSSTGPSSSIPVLAQLSQLQQSIAAGVLGNPRLLTLEFEYRFGESSEVASIKILRRSESF